MRPSLKRITQSHRFNHLFFCTGSCARWSLRWSYPQTCPPTYFKSKPWKPVYSSKRGNSKVMSWKSTERQSWDRKGDPGMAQICVMRQKQNTNRSHADSNRIDKPKALSLLLHTADISHPSKAWSLHSRWTKALMEEFFQQVGNLKCDRLCFQDKWIYQDSTA